MSVYQELRRRVAEEIEERKLSPVANADAVRALVGATVSGYQRAAHAGQATPLRDPHDMVERLWQAIAGFGPITDLLASSDVEEIFIEGDRISFIRSDGRLEALMAPTTAVENRQLIDRLLAGTNRRLDASSAIQQARVLDGRARLTAVIPPVSDRLSATLRKYTIADETLGSLVERRSMPDAAAGFLWALAQAAGSVLFSGPTGAGKTTAMSAFLRAVPDDMCIRMCEEVRELHIPLSLHSSFYEASTVAMDGGRRYSLRDLIKVCLAQRVDLLCVGEVRGEEAYELTRAVNAGCGFTCTIHANSAREALSALVENSLKAGENIPESVARRSFARGIDVVVHLDRRLGSGGSGPNRQVAEILSVAPSLAEDFTTEPVFTRAQRNAPMEWTGTMPQPDLTRRMDEILPDGTTTKDLLAGEWRPHL
ncbi:ATPase, T2SS/T4P/T4SS family [soil metagenome]